MSTKTVTLKLSMIEAEALLQLAGEADFATFESTGESKSRQARLFSAGQRSIDKLVAAIAQSENGLQAKRSVTHP